MKTNVKDTATGNLVPALISEAVSGDMPLKKDGWNFNWRQLYKTEGAKFYKLTLESSPSKIEGMLMLSRRFDKMVFMNDLETAPHNIGNGKKYDFVAGCLLAFAWRESFLEGKNGYKGYLSFESKTALIDLYCRKYGAKQAMGQSLFIDPEAGRVLVSKYLQDHF